VAETLEELVADLARAASAPLAEATSLPPAAYRSEELFALEVERLFRPGWVGVCREDQVAVAGDYVSVDLVGERLVVTRDRTGGLHVLSRVCRHRSMEILDGVGHASALQCPYHRWTYSLAGELVGAPHMGSASLRESGCALPAFRTEIWGGFVWVNLDGGAAPLAPQLGVLEEQLARAGLDLGSQVVVDTTDWGECAWDWKVMVDNFMECYHHLGSHLESLNAAYPAQAAWTDQGSAAHGLMHIVPAADPPAAPDTGWPTGDPMRDEPSCLVLVYPATMCSIRPSGTNVVRALPLGPGRIRLFIDMLAPPAVATRDDFPTILAARKEATARVNGEDVSACAAVQRGLDTPSATAGRLSPLEQPLWEFIRYLGATLVPPGSGPMLPGVGSVRPEPGPP
jgi:phenylpropionate dioxygenase-like ring-hydroxylating dioxygenase large terminal subunit